MGINQKIKEGEAEIGYLCSKNTNDDQSIHPSDSTVGIYLTPSGGGSPMVGDREVLQIPHGVVVGNEQSMPEILASHVPTQAAVRAYYDGGWHFFAGKGGRAIPMGVEQ